MTSRVIQITAWSGREHCRDRVLNALLDLDPSNCQLKRLWGIADMADDEQTDRQWAEFDRRDVAKLVALPGPPEPQGAHPNVKRWAALASWQVLWREMPRSYGSYALLIDDDIVPPIDLLPRLLDAADNLPRCGAVSAVTRCADGSLPFWRYADNGAERLTGFAGSSPEAVACCGTFCLLITSAGLRVLSEGYRPSIGVPGRKLAGHDLHLTDYLTRNCLSVYAAPDIAVEHHALPGLVLRI